MCGARLHGGATQVDRRPARRRAGRSRAPAGRRCRTGAGSHGKATRATHLAGVEPDDDRFSSSLRQGVPLGRWGGPRQARACPVVGHHQSGGDGREPLAAAGEAQAVRRRRRDGDGRAAGRARARPAPRPAAGPGAAGCRAPGRRRCRPRSRRPGPGGRSRRAARRRRRRPARVVRAELRARSPSPAAASSASQQAWAATSPSRVTLQPALARPLQAGQPQRPAGGPDLGRVAVHVDPDADPGQAAHAPDAARSADGGVTARPNPHMQFWRPDESAEGRFSGSVALGRRRGPPTALGAPTAARAASWGRPGVPAARRSAPTVRRWPGTAAPGPGGAPGERGRAAVVVLGGGSGTRLGAGVNKVYLPLAGRPVLSWSLRWAAQVPQIGAFVVVVRPEDVHLAEEVLRREARGLDVRMVVGGSSRHESEDAALVHLAPSVEAGEIDVVAVHDGARPLAGPAPFASVVDDAPRRSAAPCPRSPRRGSCPSGPTGSPTGRVAAPRGGAPARPGADAAGLPREGPAGGVRRRPRRRLPGDRHRQHRRGVLRPRRADRRGEPAEPQGHLSARPVSSRSGCWRLTGTASAEAGCRSRHGDRGGRRRTRSAGSA